jgi:hypothetical protein
MKLFIIPFLLIFTFHIQAQKWTKWQTYDTLKCDSLRVIPIPENTLIIGDWAYGEEKIIEVNKLINSVYVLYIKEQLRVNVKTGVMQKRNQVNTENKMPFDAVKDRFDWECLKKYK